MRGKYHDFDFARLELLKLLAEHDGEGQQVANDYSDIEALCQADLLVTYTCDEVPDAAGQARLKSHIEDGESGLPCMQQTPYWSG